MPRSHIHRLEARFATDIIRSNLYWSVAFRIASVTIRSSTLSYVYSAYRTSEIGIFRVILDISSVVEPAR